MTTTAEDLDALIDFHVASARVAQARLARLALVRVLEVTRRFYPGATRVAVWQDTFPYSVSGRIEFGGDSTLIGGADLGWMGLSNAALAHLSAESSGEWARFLPTPAGHTVGWLDLTAIEAIAEDLVRSPAALGPNCVECGAPGAFLDLAAYGPGRPAAHCFVCLLSAHAPPVPVATSVAGTEAVVLTMTGHARCSNCQRHLLAPGAITDPAMGSGG